MADRSASLTAMLEGCIPHYIRARADRYLRGGRIAGVEWTDSLISNRVRGSETYFVDLSRDPGAILIACSCPFFEDRGPCKHIWAVAITIEQDPRWDGSWLEGGPAIEFDNEDLDDFENDGMLDADVVDADEPEFMPAAATARSAWVPRLVPPAGFGRKPPRKADPVTAAAQSSYYGGFAGYCAYAGAGGYGKPEFDSQPAGGIAYRDQGAPQDGSLFGYRPEPLATPSARRRCMMQPMPRIPPFDRPATYDDLVKVPDIQVAEIVDGELHASPRPAPRHAVAGSSLGSLIGGPYGPGRRGPGGWWILDEPQLHLGGNILVPDLAGWTRSGMPRLPDTAFFPTAPDWVCEVISPSTASLDRAKKLSIYAREGVAHAWIVDPSAGTLEVMRLENGRWTILATHYGNEVVRAEPFVDIDLELSALWAE